MELRSVKNRLAASMELLAPAVEEINDRVNKKLERMAEEDVITLRQLIIGNLVLIEQAEGMIAQYGRSEFGSKLFKPYIGKKVEYQAKDAIC